MILSRQLSLLIKSSLHAIWYTIQTAYCCYVENAPELLNFYNSIASLVFNLEQPKACCIFSHEILENITLTEMHIQKYGSIVTIVYTIYTKNLRI